MNEIIRTENISKFFGKTHAAENISITVEKGEIYGFLGLNGAGKTTVIRILLGMIRPTSGIVYLNETPVTPGILDIWKQVGYMVETPYAYPDLTVKENLEIMRKLRGITDSTRVNTIMHELKIEKYQHVLAKHLSLGNAQRLGIAKALIHDPEILILDEPANGLDPAGIVEIRELLRHLAYDKGVTIFISSHILDEVSRFASRIGIIHQGKLIHEIKTNDLHTKLHRKLLVNAHDTLKLREVLNQEGYVFDQSNNGCIILQEERAIEFPDVIATLLVNAHVPPTLLKVEEEDLESFFLRTISSKEALV